MGSIVGQIRAIGRVLVLLVGITAVSVLATDDLLAYRRQMRGIESGASPDLAPLQSPRLGINSALERYEHPDDLALALDEMHALGFRTLRQHISWAQIEPSLGEYRWEVWDSIMTAVAERGLQLVVYVDDAPAWARRTWERENPWAPPEDPAAYARFMGAFAHRYRDVVLAYQVWDQPNIYPHWGEGNVDPAAYVALLREASQAIRAADPESLVIAGGLAPNSESGGRNLSDVRYLQEMHRLGAAPLYDVLGAHVFGFWTGPYDRRVAPDVLNYSRVILLREELRRRGLTSRPVWAVDGGWCALPEDWSGRESPSGSDVPLVQTQRLALAVERMQQEWPWLTWAALGHWQPDTVQDDPMWGYALHDANGERQLMYATFAQMLQEEHVLYPGVTESLGALQATQNPSLIDLAFWGTRLWLLPGDSPHTGSVAVRVDVQHTAQKILFPQPTDTTRLAVGRPVSLGKHTARIEGDPTFTQGLAGFQVAASRSLWPMLKILLLGMGTVAWLSVLLWHELKTLCWRATWHRCRRAWQTLPTSIHMATLLAALAAATASSNALLVTLILTAAAVFAALAPEHALLAAVLAVPLAPVMVRIRDLQFSVAEVAVLLAFGARWWEAVVTRRLPLPTRPTSAWQRVADVGMVGLVAAGLISAALAEYQRVAWREVRLCLLEPAMLYYLLRSTNDRQTTQLVVPALLAGGAVTALYALLRYPVAAGVIEAEGVRRARGLYGSPNNLALMAERLAPLAIAGALWGQGRMRRIAYGGVAAVLLTATALTFSRGSLFIGLPMGLVALGCLRGGRWRGVAILGALGSLLVAIPFLGTQRLASLADLSQGTAFLRIQLWRSAAEMIADHLWFGVGPDGFLYYYGDYIRPGAEVERWLSHPHNLVLATWTRLGLLGAVAMLAFLVGGVGMMRKRGMERSAVTIGLGASLAAALAHGMVDSFYFVPELALWLMVAVALLGVATGESVAR